MEILGLIMIGALIIIFLSLAVLLAGIWIKHIIEWGFEWYTILVSIMILAGIVAIGTLCCAPYFICII